MSRSGYYGWLATATGAKRPARRVARHAAVLEQIRIVHRRYRYYGSPRVHRELLAMGFEVGRHQVARVMARNGIVARRGKIKARPRAAPPVRRPEITDLVRRDFRADVPGELWFTDITQIRTDEGWLFAAVIMDAFNREIVSYAVNGYETPKTAITALREAIRVQKPPRGCIIHSDRGYQFTSQDWLHLAATAGLKVSIGERKSCYDNAAMESWFSSYKSEELYPGGQPATRTEARSRLFNYVWNYNNHRQHTALGYLAPVYYAAEASICP